MPPETSFPVYIKSSTYAAQFHKDEPYESDKYDLSHRNDNGLHYTAGGNRILCRNLALQFITDTLLSPAGKWDKNHYQGSEISRHVHADTEQIYPHLYQMSEKPRLIDNTRLGANLCAVFEQMEATGKSVGAAFLESPSHSMAIRLRIKIDQTTGQKKYVVAFYDPNKTGSQVRMAESVSTGLPNLRSLTTEKLLGKEANDLYFGESNTAILIPIGGEKMVTVMDCVSRKIPVTLSAPDHVEYDYNAQTLTPQHIFHLARGKFHQNIRQIASDLQSYQFDQAGTDWLINVVKGYDESLKYHALGTAMLKDHSGSTIEALAELLKLIPEKRRADVLITMSDDIFMHCVAAGKSESIKAYKKLLELVPPKQRAIVLAVLRSKPVTGTTPGPDGSELVSQYDGLSLALQNGKSDSILAYAELYSVAPGSILTDIHQHPAEFQAALQRAFKAGDTGNIRACLALLKLVPEEHRAELLKDIAPGDISAAFKQDSSSPAATGLVNTTKLQTIELYAESMALLPAEQRQRYIEPVLAPLKKAPQSSFIPGGIHGFKLINTMLPQRQRNDLLTEVVNGSLDRALLFGHDDIIADFQNRLERTPLPERAQFLQRELGDSLGTALQCGQFGFIQSCRMLLMALPESQIADVLGKLTGSALEVALESGNAKVISAYRELLVLVPANQRTALLKQITGFGLHSALSRNRADAIKAYCELLDLLPENERAGLLSDVINGGLVNALTDRNLGAIEAFGTLLTSVPEQHRAAAYLPKEEFRKKEIFQAFHSSGPPSKSTFVQMLRNVDEGLIEHFKQSKQQSEASDRATGSTGASGIGPAQRTTTPRSSFTASQPHPESSTILDRIKFENMKVALEK